MTHNKKTPKNDWLNKGLEILENQGPTALSIDNLARATGKTKGSFYHHFQNRENYVEALLAHYEMKVVLEITHEVSGEVGQNAQLKRLEELAFQISSKLELAVRAWALYDPVVLNFQDRIDQKRLDHLVHIYLPASKDLGHAQTLACKNYSLFIGLQQLRHHFPDKEFKRVLRKIYSV